MKNYISADQIKREYDYLFLGTGIVSIFQAVYYSNAGKSVLMIEKESQVGGAWTPINFAGYTDIENAIHYFLHDKKALLIMEKFLGWEIIRSKKKFQLIDIPLTGQFMIPFDGFLNVILRIVKNEKSFKIFSKFFYELIKRLIQKPNFSFYVKGGAKTIMRTANDMLNESEVEVILNTEVDTLFIDRENFTVAAHTKKNTLKGRKVVLTHGLRISEIRDSSGPISFTNKYFRRPAVHLLLNDDSLSTFNELIVENEFIKYIHDVSHMVEGLYGKKILVFGLGHDVVEYDGIYADILIFLKNRSLIGVSSQLLSYKWTDVFLPTLMDSDLDAFKFENGDLVEILKTENFSKAIGTYGINWLEQMHGKKLR